MANYADLVTAEFRKSFGNARGNGSSSLDATTIIGHPLLADTLKAIEGKTDIVDDVAAALSARADQLAAMAEASRQAPEWPDLLRCHGCHPKRRSRSLAALNPRIGGHPLVRRVALLAHSTAAP
jgi:hypothetical protein